MSDKTKSRNKKSHKSKKPETFVSGFKILAEKEAPPPVSKIPVNTECYVMSKKEGY